MKKKPNTHTHAAKGKRMSLLSRFSCFYDKRTARECERACDCDCEKCRCFANTQILELTTTHTTYNPIDSG